MFRWFLRCVTSHSGKSGRGPKSNNEPDHTNLMILQNCQIVQFLSLNGLLFHLYFLWIRPGLLQILLDMPKTKNESTEATDM